MLQRVQTLYFLGAFILTILCFFVPFADIITTTGGVDYFNLAGVGKESMSKINGIFPFLGSMLIVATFGVIFLYKKRKNQMKLCIILIVLFIALGVLAFIQVHMLKGNIGEALVKMKLPLIFPFISAILVFLGYNGVKKDEELVRSYDRIR